MNCLLDTCALLYLANGDPALGKAARRRLSEPNTVIHISVVTCAEIAIKAAKGKLILPMATKPWIEAVIRTHRLNLVPLNLHESVDAGELPWIHSDPFDRLLIATARHHHLAILTPDRIIPTYPGVTVVW